MDTRSWRAMAVAVEFTGRALSAMQEAHAQLEQAVESLSKVRGMGFERQNLSWLRRQVGRAFYFLDERRMRLRRQGALELQEDPEAVLEPEEACASMGKTRPRPPVSSGRR